MAVEGLVLMSKTSMSKYQPHPLSTLKKYFQIVSARKSEKYLKIVSQWSKKLAVSRALSSPVARGIFWLGIFSAMSPSNDLPYSFYRCSHVILMELARKMALALPLKTANLLKPLS